MSKDFESLKAKGLCAVGSGHSPLRYPKVPLLKHHNLKNKETITTSS